MSAASFLPQLLIALFARPTLHPPIAKNLNGVDSHRARQRTRAAHRSNEVTDLLALAFLLIALILAYGQVYLSAIIKPPTIATAEDVDESR